MFYADLLHPVFQFVRAVYASDTTTSTLVPIPISTSPYCKALISKLLFRQILDYADSPSISIGELVTTVVSYFDMSTSHKNISPDASISFLLLYIVSNRIVSHRIAPNDTIVSNIIAPDGNIVSNSIALNDNTISNNIAHNGNELNGTIILNGIVPNSNIVSNSIASNDKIVSNNIASNGNIVSNSIAPIGNVVSHNIVDKPNHLLSKHISYSFPSVPIRHVNEIYFTFHFNLYFDVQR